MAAPTPAKAPDEILAVLERGAWTARDPSSGWYLRYRFRGDRYATTGYPTWEESGRVTVRSVDAEAAVLRFSERIFDGRRDETVERAIELADDGSFFTMDGRRYIHEPADLVAADRDESETR